MLALMCLFFIPLNLLADCFLRVEKPGSYDPALVNENAIAHISNFVEKVKPLPPGGIKMGDDCLYNVNIIEDNRGITVTVSGAKINGSGDSRLRGIDGFQQALLQAITKSDPDKLGSICSSYHTLMKDDCLDLGSADYSITSKKLSSNPVAAKKYKMALIFKKRGKPDKSAILFDEILKKYPGSLEAVYTQMNKMVQDLKNHRKNKIFHIGLFNSVLSINNVYRSTTLYNELKVGVLNWLFELVEEYKAKGRHHEELYNAVLIIKEQNIKTNLVDRLRQLAIQWQISMGEVELTKESSELLARKYFDNAERLGISDREAKSLNEKLKASGIRSLIRKGMRDEAEMAIVEWEVDDPHSSILIALKKEFDKPENMVTIPAGKIRNQWVESFNLDKYEVTNSEYLEFVKENKNFRKSNMTSNRNDKDYLKRWRDDLTFADEYNDVPVVFVSQIVAMAYCEWKNKRLPTDREWGLAAGEGKRNYPWGNQTPDETRANYKKGFMGSPMPGDSHPAGATPEGVLHMAGNVWEWTSTIKGKKGIARGGSYYDYEDVIHNENIKMTGDLPTYSSRFTGFRCAK